jgi:hypothetical protein
VKQKDRIVEGKRLKKKKSDGFGGDVGGALQGLLLSSSSSSFSLLFKL